MKEQVVLTHFLNVPMPAAMENLYLFLFLARRRSHFFLTIDVPLVSTHNSWTFSNTVPRNEKRFLLFSCGIQQHSNITTVSKGPNDSFLLLIWPQKQFHPFKSNWNLNCLLIRKYIYFPVCFLLLF